MDAVTVAFRRSLEEFKQESRDEGREEGRQEGREEGQATILRQLAVRKFGPECGEEVALVLAGAPDPLAIARISEAILDCDGAEEFLARVRGD